MSLEVIVIVLFAALLHASWNFLVKSSEDPYHGMCAVVMGRVPYGLAALLFSHPAPSSSYVYIVAGALLHVGYQLFLQQGYKFGDLSQVYPMARGSAPLIVALVSMTFLGVDYELLQLAALVRIVGGLLSLGLAGYTFTSVQRYTAVLSAFGAGSFIAAYTLVDGFGARILGTALGYYSSVTVLNALIYGVVLSRIRPGLVGQVIRRHYLRALASGGASFSAYALVVWAFTREPIALVASLRETSIVFSVLLGVGLLHERLTRLKAMAIAATVLGVVMLKLGG
jgi:drug/metabolite transporter (DMT)-like permease